MLIERIQELSRSKFFDRAPAPGNTWQVISWWEARRIPYNLLVGVMGIVTCGLVVVTAVVTDHYLHEPIGLPNPPVIALLVTILYGIMANICFTGGWVAEILVRKIWPQDGNAFGKISFALGLVFSIALTLLPGILIAGMGAILLVVHAVRR